MAGSPQIQLFFIVSLLYLYDWLEEGYTVQILFTKR